LGPDFRDFRTRARSQTSITDQITIDENANSFLNGFIGAFPATIEQDPGPGGLPNVLTYHLSVPATQGDVLLTVNGAVSDLVRFNGNSTVIFYSFDGLGLLGDTPGPPGALYANQISIGEGDIYLPVAGQPGFDLSFGRFVRYNFLSSNAPVPEPGSLPLMTAGLLILVAVFRLKLCA
jgi:hypothetical protein